jgi:hypothetical protein
MYAAENFPAGFFSFIWVKFDWAEVEVGDVAAVFVLVGILLLLLLLFRLFAVLNEPILLASLYIYDDCIRARIGMTTRILVILRIQFFLLQLPFTLLMIDEIVFLGHWVVDKFSLRKNWGI